MQHKVVEDMISELLHLFEEACRTPFPYADSRTLLSQDEERYENLIAHLDLYFSDIASHSGGVRRLLKWSNKMLLESQQKLRNSFFEKYPQYKALETLVTESTTPDLYAKLVIYEKMRTNLLILLSRCLQSNSNQFCSPEGKFGESADNAG